MVSSLLPQSGVDRSVVGSRLEPGSGESAARFTSDRLVDHLAADRADALGVLGEDGARLLHRLGTRRERGVDRAYLCGMYGGLGAEAERHRGCDLLLESG